MPAYQRRAAVQGSCLKRFRLPIHANVAQDAASHSGDGAQDDSGHDVEPGRRGFAHADDGPQGYGQVVQKITTGSKYVASLPK